MDQTSTKGDLENPVLYGQIPRRDTWRLPLCPASLVPEYISHVPSTWLLPRCHQCENGRAERVNTAGLSLVLGPAC